MILDFNKPTKIMTEEERVEKYSSDCAVAGTYVPNMNKEDMYKWKGKHIKGKDERVEIRKTLNGVQMVIIVYKNDKYGEDKYYSGETYKYLINNNVHISANGKMLFNLKEYNEFKIVIQEAFDLLGVKIAIDDTLLSENINKANTLINDLKSITEPFKSNILKIEIDKFVFVEKVSIKDDLKYVIKNIHGDIYSKNLNEFCIDTVLPSNRNLEYFNEFRFESFEEAIMLYFNNKEV